MKDVKVRLSEAIAAQLAGAPDSTAKTELIEELSDNLYHRYQDIAASGADPEQALAKALEELGNTEELVDYLNSLQPNQPLPPPEKHEPINDLLRNVEEIVRNAMEQARQAVGQVSEEIRNVAASSAAWRSHDSHVEVHIKDDGEKAEHLEEELEHLDDELEELDAELEDLDTELEDLDAELDDAESAGWKFTAEANPAKGSFFTGAGPRKDKDIIYGFGYDKSKGGFFTQWGEYKGRRAGSAGQPGHGPCFSGTDVEFTTGSDGSYSVRGDNKPLMAVDIQVGGDVTIRFDREAGDDVVIGGDIDDLQVSCGADRVLVIRQGTTASSSFFFRRGLCSANVELSMPRQMWDLLRIASGSGDVRFEGAGTARRVEVSSVSGDLSGKLPQCAELSVKTSSGDIEVTSQVQRAKVSSVSGDVRFDGEAEEMQVSSSSGDIEVTGPMASIRANSVSGDVRVESSVLPKVMALSSSSGDVEARIPGGEPFRISFKTTSGDFDCDFGDSDGSSITYRRTHVGRNGVLEYLGGGGRSFAMSSISGDLELREY